MKMKRNFAMTCILIVSLFLSSCIPGQIISPTITPTRVIQTFTVNVPANDLWYDTGINIAKGQYVAIQAAGNVKIWDVTSQHDARAGEATSFYCDDSPCHLPRAYYGELMGRFASGTPFRIYTVFDFTAPVNGVLFLSFKEWSMEDKLSEIIVTITVR